MRFGHIDEKTQIAGLNERGPFAYMKETQGRKSSAEKLVPGSSET